MSQNYERPHPMSSHIIVSVVNQQTSYKKARLFAAGALGLAMAGINASLRANTASDLQRVFLDPIDKAHSAEMIASILGLPFLGFAITIAIGSPLLDYIGMGRLLPLSGILLSAGMLVMMCAGHLASGASIYRVLWNGALLAGIGWGLVETVVNPLTAALYPDNKTRSSTRCTRGGPLGSQSAGCWASECRT